MMRWRVFSIGRTSICIHLGSLLFAAYFFALGYGQLFVVSMISVVLHELCHGAVALAFGNPPGEIEITPMGAVMRLEDEWTLRPGRRLLMLAAGPGASLALSWLFLFLTAHGWMSESLGQTAFMCNLMLAIGNLLPVLPLDGGRILALLLGLRCRSETVKRVMRCLGMAVGMGCIALNVCLSLRLGGWNFSCGLVGCFVMYASCTATTSPALAEIKMFVERKHRLYRKGAMDCRWVAISEGAPLRCAIAHLRPMAYTMYAIVRPGNGCVVRRIGEDEIIAAYLNEPSGSVCFG